MNKQILIIGCGLLGSSLLRRIHKKKIVSKIYFENKEIELQELIKQSLNKL